MVRSRFFTSHALQGALVGGLALAAAVASAASPRAARSLDDYRHFRIAAIDLAGRMPTRDEVAAFERPDFNFDTWVDAQLAGPGYADRMTRIYMDLLRLEPNLNFSSGPAQLYRQEIEGPDGKPILVYFRAGQRRVREATDGEFCLAPDETGLVVRANQQTSGESKKVSKAVLDANTRLVHPWWLYRDYRSANPSIRFGEPGAPADPDFKLAEGLATDPGGHPTVEVRVCREEAQTGNLGHIYASGRTKDPPKGAKLAGGRLKPPPLDRGYATNHKGAPVSCESRMALDYAVDCGCGLGLERCIPNDAIGEGAAFYFPNHTPLGPSLPLDSAKQQARRWFPYWWSREAVHFLTDLFAGDRDFREILTGHQTFVNGPLAQFYKTIQRGNCCAAEVSFGMNEESEPLFDPKNVPNDLAPQEVDRWEAVPDRGRHAAGILTTPMFLEKYASARARGAALYNAFMCKSFVADNKTELAPSTEPNLMIRPGCSTCHRTLEPLAAYFARVETGNFVFLPPSSFPVYSSGCKEDKKGKLDRDCNALYDPAFSDVHGATLRSAYGSPANADAAPAGAAEAITKSPEFARCAVNQVTASFLGRATTPDDAPLLDSLEHTFVTSGYRMRALVRALVRSDTYGKSNNESSSIWRGDTRPAAPAAEAPR